MRFYTVALDVGDGRLADRDVRFKDVTTLLAPDGRPYAPFSLDPEGLALTKDRRLIFTSEGLPNSLIDPFVRRYSLNGSFRGSLPVPQPFLATADRSSGVRPNLGFESAGVTPDGRFAFVATENALYQDGPPATVSNGSPARILRYDLKTGRLDRQWVYETDPVAQPPVPATQFSVNGLVELLPLDDDHLIAMERSFSVGAPGTGNSIKLYEVALLRGRQPQGSRSEAAAAGPRRPRHPARQRRGPDVRAQAAARPPVRRARQRQQLRRRPVHAVPAVHGRQLAAMALEIINPADLPAPESVDQRLARSGQSRGDLAAQARRAFANVGRALAAAGARPEQVTKLTIYVVGHRPEYLPDISLARIAVFGDHKPADTLVGVETLAEHGRLIEVEAIAVVD